MSERDTRFDAAMRTAIGLAGLALGRTSPNPVVGCVVLDRDGAVAGTGHHAVAGGPHAEVVALAAAGPRALGGTAVVTLEPCAHTGRTGPCADALLAAGIAAVVYAVPDPNAAAAGGARRLRDAGVRVLGGVLRAEAERGNEMWLTAVRTGRPFVTWKFAGTLDGRSAAADGSSRWITAGAARRDAHALRAAHDAVVVGAGTLRADDPQLGLRHGVGGTPPVRVVVVSDGRVPPGARVLDGSAPTLVAMDRDAPDPGLPGVDVIRLPRTPGGLDLAALLTGLYARDVRSVLVEGGAALAAGFVAAGLVDRVVAYLAPALLGSGPGVLGDIGVTGMGQVRRLRVDGVDLIGEDVRVVLRPGAARTPEDAHA
ncbi:bifunctional diaminohydroxyphosphoribosylaminopyrimidine deaminase/5-amino-6-(5-phosphoribosylamino)uracil reductase RibD [Saccharothrix lopnurensis]|uniref:Riboflavin biosynthesis protein RibD n=1 Tax=Saccharothrix lopnurensis TaxID=1670621 RepID=A0ABW1PCI0_9PSEU